MPKYITKNILNKKSKYIFKNMLDKISKNIINK